MTESGPARRSDCFWKRIGADVAAKYVGFERTSGYDGGMPSALPPQTIVASRLADEVLRTKLEFENPKAVTTIYLTNRESRDFRTDRGCNRYRVI